MLARAHHVGDDYYRQLLFLLSRSVGWLNNFTFEKFIAQFFQAMKVVLRKFSVHWEFFSVLVDVKQSQNVMQL